MQLKVCKGFFMYGDKYAHRVDENQKDIVAALRRFGASVSLLHKVGGGIPDLLVGYHGVNFLLECKLPLKSSKLNDKQVKWHSEWKGQAQVVRSPQEALRALGIKFISW